MLTWKAGVISRRFRSHFHPLFSNNPSPVTDRDKKLLEMFKIMPYCKEQEGFVKHGKFKHKNCKKEHRHVVWFAFFFSPYLFKFIILHYFPYEWCNSALGTWRSKLGYKFTNPRSHHCVRKLIFGIWNVRGLNNLNYISIIWIYFYIFSDTNCDNNIQAKSLTNIKTLYTEQLYVPAV